MTRTGALVLAILVVAAVVSGWLNRSTPVEPDTTARHFDQVDYFLTGFLMDQYDATGRLDYRLRGRRLEHYPDDDSVTIAEPDLLFDPEQPERWRIEAEHARSPSTELDEVIFRGAVNVERAGAEPFTLQTERLRVEPQAERVSSDTEVVLTRPGARIVAADMHADLKENRLTLSRVRGRYAP